MPSISTIHEYTFHLLSSVLHRSVIYESINLFCPTQQIPPFLILSLFSAVRCFYSAYSNIVLIHTWGCKQPQEIQGQIPENDDDILRYMFAWNQIANVMICLHAVEQKSIGLKFSKSRTGSHVTYSCHHNSSRFTLPIFAHSWRFSVFHSLQSITPRIY